jgi:hypothetical protein
VTEVRVSFLSSRVLSLLAPCAEWLLSGGRHNRTSDGLLWMRAAAGVDSHSVQIAMRAVYANFSICVRGMAIPFRGSWSPRVVDHRVTHALNVRIATLLSSRSHSTELPTAAHCSQSAALKLTVEKACWRNEM